MMMLNFLQKTVNFLFDKSNDLSLNPLDIETSRRLDFLYQILQTLQYSVNNPYLIYPIIASNLKQLDERFIKAIEIWSNSQLKKLPYEQAQVQAAAIYLLGDFLLNFPLGDRAKNLEIIITCFEVANTIFTPRHSAQGWGLCQNGLGIAYCQRICGQRADNIEQAIKYYQSALKVLKRNKFPSDWADAHNNLGNAYFHRIKGNRKANLEKAIGYFNDALTIHTRSMQPQKWAMTQSGLGAVYLERIKGNKTENTKKALNYCESAKSALEIFDQSSLNFAKVSNNLGNAYCEAKQIEEAIDCYKDSLNICNVSGSPLDRAQVEVNIGSAYCDRIQGEKAENLEKSITYLNSGLDLFTESDFPYDWAKAKSNLGIAYVNRIRGEKRNDIETAIKCLEAALRKYTKLITPYDWARTRNNLGIAYLSRIEGDKTENLQEAINNFNSALEVYQKSVDPYRWGQIQNNIGIAYHNLALEEKRKKRKKEEAKYLKNAIQTYKDVLEVYTKKDFPNEWAMTQYNMGNAYIDRIQGKKEDNLKTSITYYREALKVYTPSAFPYNYAKTQSHLGLAYQKNQQFEKAFNVLKPAINTVELLRADIVSGSNTEEDKQELAKEWNQLYRLMVEVCLELGKDREAIEYIELSKNRFLIEELTIHHLPEHRIPEQVRNELQKLSQEMRQENKRFSNKTQPDSSHVNQLRKKYNEIFPYQPISYQQIQNLLDEKTAIIQWYVFNDCLITFLITNQSESPIVWKSSLEKRMELMESFLLYGTIYIHKKGTEDVKKIYTVDIERYKNKLEQINNNLEDIEKRWQEYNMSSGLLEMAKNINLDEIISHIPTTINHLILIPHAFLNLLPLHAFPVKSRSKGWVSEEYCLIDEFSSGVSYAPSCQLLQEVKKLKREKFEHLFAIQNPTQDLHSQDLHYSNVEVEGIKQYFEEDKITIFKEAHATKQTILESNQIHQSHCFHFSGHGYFNILEPRLSPLILADSAISSLPENADYKYYPLHTPQKRDLSKCLTLEDILKLDLTQCRLVVLSGCETGWIDLEHIYYEYIGLPSGFLIAGSPSVVSSLWRVEEISTALLIIKFYQNFPTNKNVSIALNKAQLWLRNITKKELNQWIKDSKIPLDTTLKVKLKRDLRKLSDEDRPFENPYYWAAFCAIGE